MQPIIKLSGTYSAGSMKTYNVLISEDGETERWKTIPARGKDHLYAVLDREGWDVIEIEEVT
tara:strand:- start:294 stop:479 length:186 start_codon:yes stop_codon:yes gene_type:complete